MKQKQIDRLIAHAVQKEYERCCKIAEEIHRELDVMGFRSSPHEARGARKVLDAIGQPPSHSVQVIAGLYRMD